ncbi:MAG: hypothetical protein ACJ71Y_03910 [Blastococcus sp.]
MAIKIPFLADVSRFLAGTHSIEDALDDVVDSLDDISTAGGDVDDQVGSDLESLARDGDASAEKLKRSYKDAFEGITTAGGQVDDQVGSDLDALARDGDASAEKLKRSFKDAFNAVEAQGHTSTSKVKGDVDDVGHKGSETLKEFSSEAKQNVAESVSSFNGSASSAVDAIQSTFGGLVASLGPVGLGMAAAVGVGIGLIRSQFGKAQESAEKFRANVDTLAGQLIDLGGSLDAQTVTDNLKQIITDSEQLKTIFGSDLPDALAALGSSAVTGTLQGMAGDTEDLAAAQAQLEEQLRKVEAAKVAAFNPITGITQEVIDLNAQGDAIKDTIKAVKDKARETAAAEKIEATYSTTTAGAAEAAQREADALDESNDALVEKTDANRDAASSELDLLDSYDKTSKAIKHNGETLDKHTKKGRDNQRALIDLAGDITTLAEKNEKAKGSTAAYNKTIAAQRDAFIKAAEKATGNTKAAEALAKQYGLMPKKVETEVTDNGTAKQTAKKIDDTIPHSKDVQVRVQYHPSIDIIRQIQNHLNSYTFTVGVNARSGKPV